MAKKSTVKLNFMEKITGVYLRLRSNSFYAKFLKKSNRSALPPTADYGGLPRRKTFFTIFDFARAQHFFLLKGKNFFVVFCSERAGGRAGLFFLLGRGIMGCRGKEGGKKILFRPACGNKIFSFLLSKSPIRFCNDIN